MKRTYLLYCTLAGVAALASIAVACGDGADEDDPPATSTVTVTAEAGGTPITLEDPTTTASGLQYVDEVVGTGDTPTASSLVTVHYTGWLAENGQKFDSSVDRGTPSTFQVDGVIDGFMEALLSMKVGGKRMVYMPSELGYGTAGRPPAIPANADLVFEIELLGVQ